MSGSVVALHVVWLSVMVTSSDTTAIAKSSGPEDTPCQSVEGAWMSSNMEAVFETRATTTFGRLDFCAIESDWIGGMEVLFGPGGIVSALISQPDTGVTATFVGHCRVVGGTDSMTGVWVLASPEKNRLGNHLALQPIPDTLRRLNSQ